MKKVFIQGLGFVGSAMAVAVASKLNDQGDPMFDVTGIDLPSAEGKKRIDYLNKGIFPFKTNDKDLKNYTKKAIKNGNLRATHDNKAFSEASIILVSINCDLIKANGSVKIELDSFKNSIKSLARCVSENTLVIIESTVPPGTCDKIVYPIFKKIFNKRKLNINKLYLAHSYERVMPGKNYYDSVKNYWRVYAGYNNESAIKCRDFLNEIINTKDFPLTRLSNTIASETGKVLENSYRAVNIAFMEEWGRFAEDAGFDLYEVINAIRMRPTHSNIRQPGFGVGGYCLTKDPLFAKIATKDILNLKSHDFPFSTMAIKVNSKMPLVSLSKLKKYFDGNLKNRKILLMGVTYRQDVGDTRFSPSETFVKEAIKEGADISAFDPMVMFWEEMQMELISSFPEANDYDAVVFAVPHKEFSAISLSKWITKKSILLLDANNVLTEKQNKELIDNKLNYLSIGRG
tara:strand:+ start:4662 stop:6038 length:1377 start_codon:yes stop_codon:yes gene_type:complete